MVTILVRLVLGTVCGRDVGVQGVVREELSGGQDAEPSHAVPHPASSQGGALRHRALRCVSSCGCDAGGSVAVGVAVGVAVAAAVVVSTPRRHATCACTHLGCRADWNEKEQVSLAGLDEAGVEKVFEQLTKKGETMPRSPESLEMVKLPTVMD